MKLIEEHLCFGGRQLRFRHRSDALDCDMTFSLYLPPAAEHEDVPVVMWLSGLTCTDENFVNKAGAQADAARLHVALLCPDTSPRGEGVPDDENGAWDFGLGAGFYVNATRKPWSRHYRMYDYVLDELPALVAAQMPIDAARVSLSGHSMGGHGALVMALRNPDRFASVSAFAPIVAPASVPWGIKAFGGYLGDDEAAWGQYDACRLIEAGARTIPTLVDQGDADEFLAEQLQPERLERLKASRGLLMQLRRQPGYDHSYFFIATFIAEHLEFHAHHLGRRR